jgi:hypothetical protein
VQFVWIPVRVVDKAVRNRKATPSWKVVGQFENPA